MLALSLKMTRRDWRAGELRFLLIALMIAVASLSSVGFFVDRLRNGLNRDAHQLLGADLLVSGDQPISAVWRAEAAQRGFKMAETVVFPSMAIAGEGENAVSRLVSLKAVTDAYPLRGNLKLLMGDVEVVTRDVPAAGTAWVDPALMIALNLKLGNAIKLGDQSFTITQMIATEPDRGASFMNFAPRVMISMGNLAATNLVQNGSRVTYRLLLSGEPQPIASFELKLKKEIEAEKLKGDRKSVV